MIEHETIRALRAENARMLEALKLAYTYINGGPGHTTQAFQAAFHAVREAIVRSTADIGGADIRAAQSERMIGLPVEALRGLLEQHEDRPEFASRVIAEGARRRIRWLETTWGEDH